MDHPEIFVVSNIVKEGKHIGSYDAGSLWHTDGAYLANPHAISALRALEVPVQNGRTLGDTNFASVSAAYDALPQSMKKRLEGLQAVHNWHQHDLVMWDDCSTQHKATFDYPASQPRLMHRTTVIGEAASQ